MKLTPTVFQLMVFSYWILACHTSVFALEDSDSGSRYCGAAACELAARRIGIELQSDEYKRMRQSPEVSINCVSDTLAAESMIVNSYRIDDRSQHLLRWSTALIRDGVGQSILLLVDNESTVGHYYLLERQQRDITSLVDPQTMRIHEVSFSRLLESGVQAYLVVAVLPRANFLCYPIKPGRLPFYFALPAYVCLLVVPAYSKRVVPRSLLVFLMGINFIAGCQFEDPSAVHLHSVYFSPAQIDFGDREESTPIETTVRVTNGTRESVKLERLTISCSCVHTDFAPQTLKAGESQMLNVAIVNPQLGHHTNFAEIGMSDPDCPRPRLAISYNVLEAVCLSPPTVLLSTISKEALSVGHHLKFNVEGLSSGKSIEFVEPLQLRSVKNNCLKYRLAKCVLLTEDAILHVEASSARFVGTFHDACVVIGKTKEGQDKQFHFAVSGTIVED